ncbi:tryptophan synthase beta subunit-like PLP-dependent enzyme [Bisporella sp. PMI_857]|nr:tryptophan synthase beta subunit-like PLP-dependent enzyme [Bisporella sp. PMI_857]
MSQPNVHADARRDIYYNPQALSWTSTSSGANFEEIMTFHRKIPGFSPTKLISLDDVARQIGVKAVYLKDETSRCELPSFKILGASWAAFRAIAERNSLPLDVSFEELAKAAQATNTKLFAGTDGNHGRAVARFARILGLASEIFVPVYLDLSAVNNIKSEGANVVFVEGDYDQAVQEARNTAEKTEGAFWIQDTAFKDYESIPQWIIDGYGTMLLETEQQLHGVTPDLVVVPVGVGSFAQAVTSHSKSSGRSTRVVTVEPDAAPCLWNSLQTQNFGPISTSKTIMTGMSCGTVSSISWPILQAGVDVALTISDWEAHKAVQYLSSVGVSAGPCGAATLAALQYIGHNSPASVGLSEDSIVVIFCTEGARPYNTPRDVSIDDPVKLTQALVQIDSSNPSLSRGGAGETAIADYISEWLNHRDIEVHRLEKGPGCPSIVGRVKGQGGGKSLLFNGHIDTVTTAGYTGDALAGEVRDGSVFGQGAFDMKARVAASLLSLSQARKAADANEEYLSAGTEKVLDAEWTADAAIISEPTPLEAIVAHKGFVWFEVEILGSAAHGSRPDLGLDAICKAGHFLVELDKYSQGILNGPQHPSLGTGSIHASLIQGGADPSSYPASCTTTIEWRTVPGETTSYVEDEIRTILERIRSRVPDFKYHLRMGMSRPPYEVDKSNPFVIGTLNNIETAIGRPVIV